MDLSETSADTSFIHNVAVRNNVIREVTRILKDLQELSPNTSAVDVELILERLDMLDKKFDMMHLSIETTFVSDKEKLESADQIQNDFQKTLFSAKSLCRKHLESFKMNKQTMPSKVILPKISIKPYDGRLENWRTFKNMFSSLVGSSPDLTDSQKLHHLNSLLVDDAAVQIQSLEVTDANFSVAWKILTNRYDNKIAIINTHLQSIFSCVPASRSVESLRSITSTLRLHINALNALDTKDEPLDLKSAFLIFLGSQKLDTASRREWELSIAKQSNLPSVDSFLEFLERRCYGLEQALPENVSTTTSTSVKRKLVAAPTTFQKQQSEPSRKKFSASPSQCIICNGKHSIYKCDRFLSFSTDERNKKVREAKLCTNCLNKNCKPSVCKSGVCRKCNGKHNTLLHFNKVATPNVHPKVSMASSASTSTSKGKHCSKLNFHTIISHKQQECEPYILTHAQPSAISQKTHVQHSVNSQLAHAQKSSTIFQGPQAQTSAGAINLQSSVSLSSNAQHAQSFRCESRDSNINHMAMAAFCAKNILNTNPTIAYSGSDATSSSGAPAGQTIHYLLATATLKACSNTNQWKELRSLLDSGSQLNYVTRQAVKYLQLPIIQEHCQIQGIGNVPTTLTHSVDLELESRTSDYKLKIHCLVLDTIIGYLPTQFVSIKDWNIPPNIQLADPHFNIPSRIDLLLGVEVFWDIFTTNQSLKLSPNMPYLRASRLGWVLSGAVKPLEFLNKQYTLFSQQYHDQLHSILERFWRLEHCPSAPIITEEEACCEEFFQRTTFRLSNGQFVVRLPLKDNVSCLGDSRRQALKRFLYIENRLSTNIHLRQNYIEFMNEYIALGHMTHIIENNTDTSATYYIPHHAVFKQPIEFSKIRVVFDASMKTDSGQSLNSILMVGPTIQLDLFSILLRFRMRKFAFVTDIVKMYRQIRIHSDDTRLQRIFWRSSPNEELKVYELNTVTYGTASAPFQAIRCLKQLALDTVDTFPLASQVLLKDIYVDDILSGADSLDEAQSLQYQLIEVLQSAGFQLSKWCANTPELLEHIPIESRESQFPLAIDDKLAIKTLGLLWIPESDLFQIWLHFTQIEATTTKRTILATIGSIFDPIGFLSPVVVTLKLFMKKLWQSKLDWDTCLPKSLLDEWHSLSNTLNTLNSISIPRYTLVDPASSIQLHGFADASTKAYGAVLYLRSVSASGHVKVYLLCAKSRIVPMHFVTIARLELCAALLLSDLVKKVGLNLNIPNHCTHLWSDSKIVLAYIKAPPQQWKTFVANRVQAIQDATQGCAWHHVPTNSNPADILSRGTKPHQLRIQSLWWHGPAWLEHSQDRWPILNISVSKEQLSSEIKRQTFLSTPTISSMNLFSKFSSKYKLYRITAFILRFINNLRKGSTKHSGTLTLQELQNASVVLFKLAQSENFSHEINQIRENCKLSPKSSLLSLNPFICPQGLLRVGGRLHHSNLSFDQKHPIILSPYHPLTTLIIRSEHIKLLHAGTQLLISNLRQQFWIIRIKDAIRKCILKCITCIRFKASTRDQLMGSLPSPRVIPSRAFSVTGIDYAGPFELKVMGVRSKTTHKGYIALFVCFATKALHLELVSDLTTRTFLAALDRFIGRRGIPTQIYSDNATNFVGAHRQLQQYKKLSDINQQIKSHTSNKGIEWHFSPPDGPHFGGLWEAGVKSVKSHLSKVIGTYHLNFEEFNTILVSIEACLNSRPLTPISNDPNDLNALTPGHFLIGHPLTVLTQPDLTDYPKNRLKRWQQMQQFIQLIWKRWSLEYLNTLQQRQKWRIIKDELKVDDFVLIKEPNLAPSKWKMDRITRLYPGPDNHVRVVDVHTHSGVYKRPIIRLVYLPILNDNSTQP